MEDPNIDYKGKRPCREDSDEYEYEDDLDWHGSGCNRVQNKTPPKTNVYPPHVVEFFDLMRAMMADLTHTIDILERVNLIKLLFDVILANIDIVKLYPKLHFHVCQRMEVLANEISLKCPEHSNTIDFERYRAALRENT